MIISKDNEQHAMKSEVSHSVAYNGHSRMCKADDRSIFRLTAS
jgi:hypothetical protein